MSEGENGALTPRSVDGPAERQTGSTAIKIDKGIPLAPRRGGKAGGRPATSKYPFAKMEIGDSFIAPAADTVERAERRASAAAFSYKKRANGSFAIRTIEENGQRVVRVWRVA